MKLEAKIRLRSDTQPFADRRVARAEEYQGKWLNWLNSRSFKSTGVTPVQLKLLQNTIKYQAKQIALSSLGTKIELFDKAFLHTVASEGLGTHEAPPSAAGLKASRSQDWYSRMQPDQRTKYLKKYPGTKFHDKTTLAVPE